MKTEILALIPARGGSKSIPRKNLVTIAGKPLIAHTIGQGLSSEYITRTLVSTDDEEIAAASREHGAEVPFIRPAEFAQDLSPDIDVFRHTLEWLLTNERYEPDLVVHLRPTGPVRRVELIDAAIRKMLDHPEADCLRSVIPAEQTPYKMWRVEGDYLAPIATVPGIKESWSQPRQKLPPVYWQNGYVDIVRPRTVLEMGVMCGGTILPFIINEPKLELDYVEDIPVLEEALRRLERGEPLAPEFTGERHAV